VAALRDPNSTAPLSRGAGAQTLGWQPGSDDTGTTFFVALGELEQAREWGPRRRAVVVLLRDGAYRNGWPPIELLSQIDDARVVKPLVDALKARTASCAQRPPTH